MFSQTKRKVSSLNSPLHPGEVQISHPATHWKAFGINLPYSPDTSFVFFFGGGDGMLKVQIDQQITENVSSSDSKRKEKWKEKKAKKVQ